MSKHCVQMALLFEVNLVIVAVKIFVINCCELLIHVERLFVGVYRFFLQLFLENAVAVACVTLNPFDFLLRC